MELDLPRFYRACNPARTIDMEKAEDRKYYIDFSSVRGGKIIERLRRMIAHLAPDSPTCQLFTGHIGCGKSTELLRLCDELQHEGFHVVYFESTQALDTEDLDVTDILLAIVQQVTKSLEDLGIRIKPNYFTNLFGELKEILQTPIELSELSLSMGIAKITAQAKDSPRVRSRLRQYLEPRTNSILESINQEVLGRATEKLRQWGKKGLVVIVDNLDRVGNRIMPTGKPQPEYLFVDRGEQLRKLNCHVVYTIPLGLIFSNESQALMNRLGGGIAPKVLPMVPVQRRDGSEDEEGMKLLREMVLARAFPEVPPEQRLGLITKVFDSSNTLDRLCRISGGHVRNLLGLLYSCLQEEDPPLSRTCLETMVRHDRDRLLSAIDDEEWELIFQVVQQQNVRGDKEYQILLRSLFIFEYQDQQGRWFGINPALTETEKYKSWLQST